MSFDVGIQDIIALVIVAVAVVYAGRSLWRTLHGETGCAGGCGRSDLNRDGDPSRERKRADGLAIETPPNDRASRALKRTPLVTIDDVGRPTHV